jgi:hypothetical protein
VSTLPDAGLGEPTGSLPPQQDTGRAQFVDLRILGEEAGHFLVGQSLNIVFSMRAIEDLPKLVFAVSIYRSDGDWLIGQSSRDAGVVWDGPGAGETSSGLLDISPLCLAPGDYMVAFAAYAEDYSICFALTDLCLSFSVRADFPTWGKFHHPCRWLKKDSL